MVCIVKRILNHWEPGLAHTCVLLKPVFFVSFTLEHRQIKGLVQDNVQTDSQANKRYCNMHILNKPPWEHVFYLCGALYLDIE